MRDHTPRSPLGASGVAVATIGNYSLVIGQSLRTLLVARILGPASFGILNLANVGANSTIYSDLGTGVAGQQQASEARGRSEAEHARRLLIRMGRARMFPAVVLAATMLLAAITAAMTGYGAWARILAYLSIAGLLQSIWYSVHGWLRVEQRFGTATVALLGQVAIWVIGVPWAAWKWGLVGALYALALSYLPPSLIAARHCPVHLLLLPSWRAFRELVPSGLPVWMMMVSSFLMVNVDQVLAGQLLGADALGLYAIGMLSANALVAFSDGASSAAHPQTLETYAREGHLHPDLPSVTRVMRVVEIGFSFLVPLAWLGMAFLAEFFLVEYRAALPVVALLGVAAALIGIPTASNSALLAVGLHRRVPVLFLSAIVVKVAIALPLIAVWRSPQAVAAVSLVGGAFYSCRYLSLVACALGVQRGRMRFVVSHLHGVVVLASLAAATAYAAEAHGIRGYWWAAGSSLVISVTYQGATMLAQRWWRGRRGAR